MMHRYSGAKKSNPARIRLPITVNGLNIRDEDPTFFSTDPDPDPAQLEKYSGSGSDSGSDLKSK